MYDYINRGKKKEINSNLKKELNNLIGEEKTQLLLKKLDENFYINDEGILYSDIYLDYNDKKNIEEKTKEEIQEKNINNVNIDDIFFNIIDGWEEYENNDILDLINNFIEKYDLYDYDEEIKNIILQYYYMDYEEIKDIILDTDIYIDIILGSKQDTDTEGHSKQLIKKYIPKNELKEIKENIYFNNEEYFLATQLKTTLRQFNKNIKNKKDNEKINICGDFTLINCNNGSCYDYYFLNKKDNLFLDIKVKKSNLYFDYGYNLTDIYCNDYCTISNLK